MKMEQSKFTIVKESNPAKSAIQFFKMSGFNFLTKKCCCQC